MTQLYVGIGHGIEPDGTYDPGATHGHLVEHDLAGQVVEAITGALSRSGFHDYIAERYTPGHPSDVDYRGSVTRANAAGCSYVVEVHFNAGGDGGGHGTEVLCYADAGVTGEWAHRMQAALSAAVGIVNRGVKSRPDLWLLRGTTGHALIPEVAFVDGDATAIEDHPQLCAHAGEAIAAATLAQLGHHYVPPGALSFAVTSTGGHGGGRYANVNDTLAEVRHLLVVGASSVTVTREKV